MDLVQKGSEKISEIIPDMSPDKDIIFDSNKVLKSQNKTPIPSRTRINNILISQYRTTTRNRKSRKFKETKPKRRKSSSFSFGINSLKTLSKSDETMKYWRDKGLTDWHVNNWTKEITKNIEETEKCLTYAYHDLNAGKKKVNNPLGYLYKTIERAGTYTKPQNYKTEEEIQIEKTERIAADKVAREDVLAKEKEKQDKIERNKAEDLTFEKEYGEEFKEMLDNPRSETCKKCLKLLNSDYLERLIRERLRKSPHGLDSMRSPFRRSMVNAFLKLKKQLQL